MGRGGGGNKGDFGKEMTWRRMDGTRRVERKELR